MELSIGQLIMPKYVKINEPDILDEQKKPFALFDNLLVRKQISLSKKLCDRLLKDSRPVEKLRFGQSTN